MIEPERPLQLAHPRARNAPPLDLQRLWFATLRWEWTSLVLVPADSNLSVERLAKALAQVGEFQGGRALKITDEGTMLVPAGDLAEEISRQPKVQSPPGDPEHWKRRAIIAIEPISSNPAGIAVAVAADAALLCVELGKTEMTEARRTVDAIGHEHFKGCVLVK